MTTLLEIRDGLAVTLQAIPKLRVYNYVPDAPQPPCVVIIPDAIQYQELFSGEASYRLVLQVMTAAVNNVAGQTELDELLAPDGERSIARVLREHPTLEGMVAMCDLTEMRNYGTIGDAVRYYSAQLMVDIWAL